MTFHLNSLIRFEWRPPAPSSLLFPSLLWHSLSEFLLCTILPHYCPLLPRKGNSHSPLTIFDSGFSWRVLFSQIHTGTAVSAGSLESCPGSLGFLRHACARMNARSLPEWVHSTLDLRLTFSIPLPPVSLRVLAEPGPRWHTDAAWKQQVLSAVLAGSHKRMFSLGVGTDRVPEDPKSVAGQGLWFHSL